MIFVLDYCPAFHDSRDCRDCADEPGGVLYVDDLDGKGKNKHQHSGDLIDNGMYRCQRVMPDESDNDIDKLDQRDHTDPYDHPNRQFKDRQELYQYDRGKNDIGKGIEPCAGFCCGIRFPRYPAVKDIG